MPYGPPMAPAQGDEAGDESSMTNLSAGKKFVKSAVFA